MRAPRSRTGTPTASNSRANSPPTPTPKTKRPPHRRSSVATCLAINTGWRRGTRYTDVPNQSRSVCAAASASCSSGSRIGIGKATWSPTQSESKPSRSASSTVARAAGALAKPALKPKRRSASSGSTATGTDVRAGVFGQRVRLLEHETAPAGARLVDALRESAGIFGGAARERGGEIDAARGAALVDRLHRELPGRAVADLRDLALVVGRETAGETASSKIVPFFRPSFLQRTNSARRVFWHDSMPASTAFWQPAASLSADFATIAAPRSSPKTSSDEVAVAHFRDGVPGLGAREAEGRSLGAALRLGREVLAADLRELRIVRDARLDVAAGELPLRRLRDAGVDQLPVGVRELLEALVQLHDARGVLLARADSGRSAACRPSPAQDRRRTARRSNPRRTTPLETVALEEQRALPGLAALSQVADRAGDEVGVDVAPAPRADAAAVDVASGDRRAAVVRISEDRRGVVRAAMRLDVGGAVAVGSAAVRPRDVAFLDVPAVVQPAAAGWRLAGRSPRWRPGRRRRSTGRASRGRTRSATDCAGREPRSRGGSRSGRSDPCRSGTGCRPGSRSRRRRRRSPSRADRCAGSSR